MTENLRAFWETAAARNAEPYRNGFNFGLAYARNHGVGALLRYVKQASPITAFGITSAILAPDMNAGIVDAALAVVQGVK